MEYRDLLETIKKHPHALQCAEAPSKEQRHDHEFLGSTHLAEAGEDRHNHRFAGVTGEAIPVGNGKHIHQFRSNTDFFENHFHQVMDRTGVDIEVSEDKHVHFVDSFTTVNDGHRHRFKFATLIEDPLH